MLAAAVALGAADVTPAAGVADGDERRGRERGWSTGMTCAQRPVKNVAKSSRNLLASPPREEIGGAPAAPAAASSLRASAPRGRNALARTGGATSFPRLEPRPAYPPASEVVPRFIVSFLRFTLLTAIFGVASRPAFEWLHATFEQHLLPLLEGRFHGHPSDVLFAIGLTLAVNTTYTVVNGFFAVCDRWKLLQHYKLAHGGWGEPRLVAATLRKEAFAHLSPRRSS